MMRLLTALRLYKLRQLLSRVLPHTLSRYRVRVFFVIIVLFGIAMYSVFDIAYAQLSGENIGMWILKWITFAILQLSEIFMLLTIFFLQFFIAIAGYNNFIDVGIVKLGWVMVRDVANMFFVIALLVIAFATMLGLEKYEWKKGMAKLILMAILINFSNLIAQLVIDVAHVFTITFLNAIANTAGGNLINMFNMQAMVEMLSGKDFGNTEVDFTLTMFAGGVMALFFAITAAASIGAYAIIMAIRVAVLWALIVLSPIAFLMFAMPKGEAYAQEWWKEFSKHVIVAPVMVFFLWLAFATLGQGDILSQMEVKVTKSDEIQSISLLKASEWEKMGGFILAIIFLWIGLKKTKESGVTGSDMAGTAMNMAKKGTMLFSGAAAARWAGKKGAGLAGKGLGAAGLGIAKRIPYVGTAALKEYGSGIASTFQRKGLLGLATGGKKSGLGGYEGQVARSERAKNLEDKGMLGWMAARFIEPAGRAEKRAEDWKKGAEAAKYVRDESYSTSGSHAGQSKINEINKKVEVELRGGAKGTAKIAERKQEALLSNLYFEDHVRTQYEKITAGMDTTKMSDKDKNKYKKQAEKDVLKDTSKMKNIEETVLRDIHGDLTKDSKGNYKNKDVQKTADVMKRDGGIKSRILLGRDLAEYRKGYAKAQAGTEEGKKFDEKQKEMSVAEQRDKILKNQGDTERFVAQATDNQTKKREEEFSGLDYSEIIAQAQNMAGKLNASLIAGLNDPRLSKSMSAILTAAMKRGAETGGDTLDAVLKQIGFEEKIQQQNMLGMQRKFLSGFLGQNVDTEFANENGKKAATESEAVANAFAKYQKIHGEDATNAMMKNMNASFKVMAGEGDLRGTGLIDDDEVVDGRIKYKMRKANDDGTVPEGYGKAREYFAVRQKVSQLTGVDGIVNEDESGKYSIANDEQAQKQLLDVLNEIKGNTHLQSVFKIKLKKLFDDDSKAKDILYKELNSAAQGVIDKEVLGIKKP